MSDECLICEKVVTGDKCVVGELGILGLITASKSRRDGKFGLLSGVKSVVVHASCRKRYTRAISIAVDIRGSTSSAFVIS